MGARRRGRGRDRDDALDDRRDGSRERCAGDDPRRPRRLDAGQPRARLRLARVGRARDRTLVLNEPAGLPDTSRATSRTGRANEEYTDARAEKAWAGRAIDGASGRCRRASCTRSPTSTGKDVVELGCGTAYFGAWLKKAGAARVVGVDPTPAQLETARRCNEKFGLGLEFVEAFGEDVPLPDASFDLVFSEYGASIWADPYKWIPEAARLLRPGGELVFLRNSTLVDPLLRPTRTHDDETLQRPQFGMHEVHVGGQAGSSTTCRTASWIRILRANGFEILER